jgi:hypothetical protein
LEGERVNARGEGGVAGLGVVGVVGA